LVPIELFARFHYRKSIGEDADLPELFKDVFLFYWSEKSQYAIVDELAGTSSLSAAHPAPAEDSRERVRSRRLQLAGTACQPVLH
jgi:hypothetical protein